MFDNLFKKKTKKVEFKKAFPAFLPYIIETDKHIFTSNESLVTKYDKNSAFISSFIFELKKDYKDTEITDIIKKYFINLSDVELVSMISTYLSLDIQDKEEKKFFVYYDEKHNLIDGDEDYIDEEELNNRFYIACGFDTYNGIPLKDIYETLDLKCKLYLVRMLENSGSFKAFKSIFEYNYKANINLLIRLLMNKNIDTTLFNLDVLNNLDDYHYKELIYTLLSNSNVEISRYVKVLINKSRYDILSNMISFKLLSDHIFVSIFDFKKDKVLSDDDIINTFERTKNKRYSNN